ncbi:hypothetical protein [Hyphomonas sp. UBA4494]|jgi:hypothetical protein|uniref:hypothetical protein n=1 Tax=Hyphomonas sp. UBA4494 TaxID=1946631 RepID=UPI0025BAC552|nr:hypothetical protein [Hyphomonas sp. UBA4494]
MSFISVLKEYRKGALLAALDEELLIVASEVEEKGKSGSLTLTLSLKPNGQEAVTMAAKVSSKIPKETIGDAIYFVQAGNLSRSQPDQLDMLEDEVATQRSKKEGA